MLTKELKIGKYCLGLKFSDLPTRPYNTGKIYLRKTEIRAKNRKLDGENKHKISMNIEGNGRMEIKHVSIKSSIVLKN